MTNIQLSNCDLQHHMRFIGTTGDGRVPTPIEMVSKGALPLSYLDQFGPDSTFHAEIVTFLVKRER